MPTRRSPRDEFDAILRAAVEDFRTRGYIDEDQLRTWQERLRRAAIETMTPWAEAERRFEEAMRNVYRREIERGGAIRRHRGVSRFTLDRLRPSLHGVLARSILANAELIKLNREETIEKTMRRFAGWATSVPPGGTAGTARREVEEDVKTSLRSLPFRERRVLIDQGHKLVAAIHETIAQGEGAIAAVWVSHWHDRGYDYREDHKQRAVESERKPYVVRDSWAMEAGLVKLAGSKYTDEMTKPGEEVYCRCHYRYLYNLRDLPESMLTKKGSEALRQARKQLA